MTSKFYVTIHILKTWSVVPNLSVGEPTLLNFWAVDPWSLWSTIKSITSNRDIYFN